MQDCFRIKITIKTITGPLNQWHRFMLRFKIFPMVDKPIVSVRNPFVYLILYLSASFILYIVDNKGMAILLTGYFQHVNNRNVLHSRSLSAIEIEYDVAYRCD